MANRQRNVSSYCPFRTVNLLIALPILSIFVQWLGGQLLASSAATSTPYPDANARPTITTKLENLSGIYKLASGMNATMATTTTSTTESYPKLFSDDDNHGNKTNNQTTNNNNEN